MVTTTSPPGSASRAARNTAASEYRPIEDYAVIGNGRAAGLISRDGAIDWLCLPRFDSPSLFGALLDTRRGGQWWIRPQGDYQVKRRYVPDTNILETIFRTHSGDCLVRDGMMVADEDDQRRMLHPEHELLRELVGLTGTVQLEIHYEPRPNYGREAAQIADRGRFGFWCTAHGGALILQSEIALDVASDGASVSGSIVLAAGERRFLALTFDTDAPAVIPPLGDDAGARMLRAVRWWQAWAGRCRYTGPYRDAVVRSALALKLLTFAPSGAIIAAPTTSLPEQVGADLNWDYRYCWLRDAALTVRALLALGYEDEGEAFLNWMMQATRLTWPELQVVYDIWGEAHIPESELGHLEGYKQSRPVRIGNDAFGQLQLDVYGAVIDAATRFAAIGGEFDRDQRRFLSGLGRTVCKRWQEPDAGIWEGRDGRSHFTHSKVMCWTALNGLIELHERYGLDLRVEEFFPVRDAIRAAIEAHGYNERLGSYTRKFDGDELDASLLMLPLYGYIDAAHPRMQSTWAAIREHLGRGTLIYRYLDNGQLPGEGAFGICSFWSIECRALAGDRSGARHDFEQLLRYGNDVGLFAEEIDPATGTAIGNFPQGFTHIGLINVALTIDAADAPIPTDNPQLQRSSR